MLHVRRENSFNMFHVYAVYYTFVNLLCKFVKNKIKNKNRLEPILLGDVY